MGRSPKSFETLKVLFVVRGWRLKGERRENINRITTIRLTYKNHINDSWIIRVS